MRKEIDAGGATRWREQPDDGLALPIEMAVPPIAVSAREGEAWACLRALRAAVEAGEPVPERPAWLAAAAPWAEALLPLAAASRSAGLVHAVLGQTLDGYIATRAGDSRYVNGPGGLVHLHRLRALSDAVLVGASTAVLDRPRLTTRHVEGPSPVRVIIDPNGRLGPESPLVKDGAATTFVLRAADGLEREVAVGPAATLLFLRASDGRFSPGRLVAVLRERGLTRLLVEGGGATVSRFLAAGALDRLHLLVAPLLLGGGRPGISLPAADCLAGALRPACRRYLLAEDVLFDLDLGPATCRLATPG